MSDPLGPPDPNDPWWVPPDWPRFDQATPAPVDPVPPPGRLCCPACGTVFAATLGKHSPGDYAICAHCATIVVFMPDGHPRLCTFDEAVEAEADPRIRLLQTSFGPPLPEAGGPEDS